MSINPSPRTLFLFYSQDRTLLFVSKNSNLQAVVSKEWWKEVHHIIVQQYESLDDMEHELLTLKGKGTKWNFR